MRQRFRLLPLAVTAAILMGSCSDDSPTTVDYVGDAIQQNELELAGTGVEIEMVWIEPGSFRMGELGTAQMTNPNEQPRHIVSFAHGFWISKYEITQEQWEAVTGYNPSRFTSSNRNPVESVSWRQIQEDYLSVLNERLPTDPWRLPTEAEWEYAARAGTRGPFFVDAADLGYYANFTLWTDSTLEVGSLLPNPWGLYDMAGNVWEWCWDTYHDNYADAPLDGSAWNDNDGIGRVIRGGGWGATNDECRSAYRDYRAPTHTSNRLGFRLVYGETWTNNPPVQPTIPSPADAAVDIEFDIELSWSCHDLDGDPLVYDIYLSTNRNPTLIATDITDTTYHPSVLDVGETYYWRVAARDRKGGITFSPTWSFTTYEPFEYNFALAGTDELMTMIRTSPAVYTMGSSYGDEDAQADEHPPHQVAISYVLWVGKFEVTQQQWQAVMGSNPSYHAGFPDRPVEQITWDMAQAFVDSLNAYETGDPWRLPTEAEWEYVVRADQPTRFPWGDDPDFTALPNYAWYEANSGGRTHAVGGKLPNPWGFYDLIGNVGEWCEDWYHLNYTSAPNDGSAWTYPAGIYRVYRGGSWTSSAVESRSAARFGDDPQGFSAGIGLRVVRDATVN